HCYPCQHSVHTCSATTVPHTLSLHDALPIYEGRIEAHPELADQARVGLLLAAQRLQEAAGAGTGDAADVGHHLPARHADAVVAEDRKSTRLNSSHVKISYAVFCLKKKKCLVR